MTIVLESISAEHFRDELEWLREKYGDTPDEVGAAYTGILTDLFVESTGLFAALHLPLPEVPAALAEIAHTLAHLDFDAERKRLRRSERPYYARFAALAGPLWATLGECMQALFNCYVAGDYDPTANPDDLIARALEVAEEDLESARHMITQAGAIGLDSHPLWWRWSAEASGPARMWLITMAGLVGSYTADGEIPLGPVDPVRTLAQEPEEELDVRASVVDEVMGAEEAEPAPSPMDALVDKLIEQGEEGFRPDQVKFCRDHREEAIPALIELATDEYLQGEDAPGAGYAPISAVKLLGQLRATEAIRPLIDIVADSDPMAIIRSTAIYALKDIGEPALESVLTFMRYSWDIETKTALAEVVDEVGQPDEQAYQTLVAVWQEATWGEGKCLLAHTLAHIGGERAIPLLQAALQDPDLEDELDYNEIAYALSEVGIEAPPPPAELHPAQSGLETMKQLTESMLAEMRDPEHLKEFADMVGENWQADPDDLAHFYTAVEQDRWNGMVAVEAITQPAIVKAMAGDLLEAVKGLAFDASTRGHARPVRKAYAHLAECAGPALRLQLTGMLLALQHYLNEDYDIAEDPDELLAAARALAPDGEAQRHQFGRAGALILHGRPFWPLWPAESDLPLSAWLDGLVQFREPLERSGHIPLHPLPGTDPVKLSKTLLESLRGLRSVENPPAVIPLLDLLMQQKQDYLPSEQRRRFVHRRAEIVPHLISIVEQDWLQSKDSPGGGWAPILAVHLLGELKAAQAADTLVRTVANSDPEDIIHDAALFSLMAIGSQALPAVQAYMRYGRQIETRACLAEVLAHVGRKSPNTFDLLRQVWEAATWEQNRRMVALAWGDLGDHRATSLLQSALEDRSADELDLAYAHWALHRLAGQAPPLPQAAPGHLNAPAPANPRLIPDPSGPSRRLRYSVWGEPLCLDCGQPLVRDASGHWTHPPEKPAGGLAPAGGRHRRKGKRRRH
jgi:HEAT repeat protein